MEFVVKTDLAKLQPQEIESNFEETKQWLESALAPYSAMVVSEDAIADAKKSRAEINKVKLALDEKRKSVKKQWVQPFLVWEAKVNELIALCDSASKNIDNQVKNFENTAKEQKKAELKEFFDTNASAADVDFYINFEMAFNPKWLNASVKIETAKQEIDDYIQQTVDDLKMISDLESDFNEELFLDYKNNHDVRRVIARNKALSEIKANSNIPQKPVQQQKVQENVSQPSLFEEPTAPVDEPQTKEKLYDLLLQLKLTASQAKNLKRFMAEAGIEIVQSKMKENKE